MNKRNSMAFKTKKKLPRQVLALVIASHLSACVALRRQNEGARVQFWRALPSEIANSVRVTTTIAEPGRLRVFTNSSFGERGEARTMRTWSSARCGVVRVRSRRTSSA
jgi:hypothetical protein